jgi:hypothetical protein
MNYPMILDTSVHRILEFDRPLIVGDHRLFLKTNSNFSAGHCLELEFPNGAVAIIRCDSLRPPPHVDAYINPGQAPEGNQMRVDVPEERRICVLGKELSNTKGISLILIHQKQVTNGTFHDLFLYNDNVHGMLVFEVFAGNYNGIPGGYKIPPYLD